MEAFYGLPQEVKFCKKCVVSNQRPNSAIEFKHKLQDKKKTIFFDANGICDACNYNLIKAKEINWEDREKKLLKLLDKFRSKDGNYDVVIPGSGGKDSAYASHLLKYKYGMNPLTVTWAPHLYTSIGWENFTNWIHEGGFDNILFTPNGRLHRLLTKKAFLNLLHPFQPFIIGQKIIGPAIAARYGIKLVFYGENQAEDGNSLDENNIPTMDKSFFTASDPLNMILGGESISSIINSTEFTLNDFNPYIPPDYSYLEEKEIEVFYLGYFLKWDRQECYYYASENTGFKANSERTPGTYSKYSSIDDKIDMFHFYTMLIKFGLGRTTYDAAQEIRDEKITREEAVYLVNKYDQEFPHKYFQDFIKYIDITEDEFHATVDKFRSPHLWEKVNNKWKLRNKLT